MPDGKYPFAVRISVTGIPVAGGGLRNSSCSGGLISPHWVLTAGHCFRDTHDKHVSHTVGKINTVTVDRADLSDKSGGYDAKIIAVKQNATADVALVELDKPIYDVTPMKLNRAKPKVGQAVRLTGYGDLTAKDTDGSTELHTGSFKVVSVSDIEVGMSGTKPKTNTSPCAHDSGGPYFTEAADGTATVVGVVSHGPDCPHTGADQASRIDVVASWITSIVGSDRSPSPKPPPPPPTTAASTRTVADNKRPTAGTGPFPFDTKWVVLGGGVAVALVLVITATAVRSRSRSGSRHRQH